MNGLGLIAGGNKKVKEIQRNTKTVILGQQEKAEMGNLWLISTVDLLSCQA